MREPRNLDKLQHFGAGAGIATAPLLLKVLMPDLAVQDLVKAGLLLSVLAAAVKEWRNAQGYGTSDGADFVTIVAGGLVAAVLLS